MNFAYLVRMKSTLFFLFIALNLQAQDISKLEQKQKSLEIAKSQLQALKNGFLLVRLDDKKTEIDYYLKHNNIDEANKIQAQQDKIDEQIRLAFEKYFTMCPVYYFKMSDTRNLLEEKYDAVQVYDAQGQLTTNVDLTSGNFFIAEFGVANQDEVTNDEAVNDGEYMERMAVSALVIRQNNMLELRDPFPYFVKYNTMGGIKSRYLGPVRRWQEKLTAFEAR